MSGAKEKIEQLDVGQVSQLLGLPSPPLMGQASFNSKNPSAIKSQQSSRPPLAKKTILETDGNKIQSATADIPTPSNLKLESKQPYNALNSQPNSASSRNKLSKVRSDTKLTQVRESTLSNDKRMRLRQYLFTAKKSLQKNRERRNQILRQQSPICDNKASVISELRQRKYYLPKEQVHKVVQKSIVEDLKEVMKSLQQNLSFVQGQKMQEVSQEDLNYLYGIRKIITAQLQPTVQKLKVQKARRQQFLFEGILSLGKTLVQSKEQYIGGDIPIRKVVSKVEPDIDIAQSLVLNRPK